MFIFLLRKVVSLNIRPEMSFNKITGEFIGKLVEPYTCCDPFYNIYDSNNEVRYVITANCCQCGFYCRSSCGKCCEVHFQIHKPGKQEMTEENEDGSIIRKESDIFMVSDADNFILNFPKDATPEEKILLIGNVLMIDYRFYEKNEFVENLKKRRR